MDIRFDDATDLAFVGRVNRIVDSLRGVRSNELAGRKATQVSALSRRVRVLAEGASDVRERLFAVEELARGVELLAGLLLRDLLVAGVIDTHEDVTRLAARRRKLVLFALESLVELLRVGGRPLRDGLIGRLDLAPVPIAAQLNVFDDDLRVRHRELGMGLVIRNARAGLDDRAHARREFFVRRVFAEVLERLA